MMCGRYDDEAPDDLGGEMERDDDARRDDPDAFEELASVVARLVGRLSVKDDG